LHPGELAAQDAGVEIRDTRYARAPDGAYIAYQVTGEGPIHIVWGFDLFGNEDAGEQELEGVPDRWHLYRVVS
jgi:hypothetical protein